MTIKMLMIAVAFTKVSFVFSQQKKVDIVNKPFQVGGIKSDVFTVPCKQIISGLGTQGCKVSLYSDDLSQKELKDGGSASPTPKIMSGIEPFIGESFETVATGSCQQSNTIAISDAGKIVTMVNSSLSFYNSDGTIIYTSPIWNWIGNPNLAPVSDPYVLYDPIEDKFIFQVVANDGYAANSKVVIGFSASSDPAGAWYLYELTGNPLNDGSLLDFPRMGISTNELYITGSLYDESGGGFHQAVIYQIKKSEGFTGGSLNWQYWHSLAGAPYSVLPVSYGQDDSYGPGVYLVATQGFTTSNTVYLYDITNDLTSSSESLNQYIVNTNEYYKEPPLADQPSLSSSLYAGDARALSGFYLNGKIHFVFNTGAVPPATDRPDYMYVKLDISTLTDLAPLDITYADDVCFPAIASMGVDQFDESVVITYNKTGQTAPYDYPGLHVIFYDASTSNWSFSETVQDGYSVVDCYVPDLSATGWGKYTGIARKYNSASPTVWVAGSNAGPSTLWENTVAEIKIASMSSILNSELSTFNLYPNPVTTVLKMDFMLESSQFIKINIVDIKGRVLNELFKGEALLGLNNFSFNLESLDNGMYFLNVYNVNNQILKSEKFVVSH
jgi:hypothetical protein